VHRIRLRLRRRADAGLAGRRRRSELSPPLAVIDDDPTGAQTLAGVRVLLDWSVPAIREALAGRPSVHLLTNARALGPGAAYAIVRDAAATAREAVPDARFVLRGDSTLRGHILEEYLALRDATLPRSQPVLLLVMALPSAGRVTVGGVHWIERAGRRVPLHETEYARDEAFAYESAHLLTWAEQRTDGLLPAAAGRELPLDELRSSRGGAVTQALLALSGEGRAATFAPDAETDEDLALIARGLDGALEEGAHVIVRAAPAFVGIASGTGALRREAPPSAGGRILVVCGSYVPTTTRQLAKLAESRPGSLLEADAGALASQAPDAEIARLARATDALLAASGLAVVATPRERPPALRTLEAGERVAQNLARVVGELERRPRTVVAKGGITSAVTLRMGLGATAADVVGPVLPGVSLWRARARDGELVDYYVVPGNVGADSLLVELVDVLERGRSR
jgi:uncharacterized protein YgbK (DUF1537 family)